MITLISMSMYVSDLSAAARKAPYLIYENNVSQMTVLWQLYTASSCLIQWGFDESYSLGSAVTVEYGSDHQHKYVITGLTPGQLYYYRVTAGGQTYTGSFRSAPDSNADQVKFMIYGDSRTFPAVHDQVAAEMLASYALDPDFQTITLSVGDLVTDGDNEAYWDSEHFNPNYSNIKELLGSAPYMSVLGNHENSGILYMKYFPYPFINGRYWSFDYGPVHFTVIDQYSDYSPGSQQYSWIANDLATTTRNWKLIYLHEPGWSAGVHENDTCVQYYLQPLCVQYGVSIVFAGHNHYYARAVVGGVQHITTGGGAAPLHSPDPNYPYIVAVSMNYHFCRVEINNNILHCEAITPGGAVIDSFTIASPMPVPSLSEWGIAIMSLLLLAAGSTAIIRNKWSGFEYSSKRRG